MDPNKIYCKDLTDIIREVLNDQAILDELNIPDFDGEDD